MAMIALVLAALAATVAALPVDPEPSLKHDTDVVRMAPPNRRMFLVDLIRPASTSDPLLTNEIGTSADAEIPRLVRLLVTDQRLELDAASKGLSRPRPFASADLSAPSSTAAPVPSPAEDLLPPAAGQPDQWAANVAQPREDVSEAGVEIAEPSGELQPPAASATGVWELYEGIKMVEAGEVAAEAKAESRADEAGPVAEPATELLPPPAEQPDILSGLSSWTARLDSTAASDSAPAKLVVPEAAAVPDVPEPATHLLPPAPDSYVPAQPSSGQAGADDFLTLAAAPPAADARAEYVQDPSDKRDSYLPEAGELKFLAEGPIVDDFLAIGEPPKQEETKGEPDAPTTQPKEGSSETMAPAEAAGETSATSKEDPVKDSYSPTSEETSAIVSTQEDAVKEHVTDQDHDHEYVKLEAGSKGTEDVGVVSTSSAPAHRERLLLGKLGESGER